MRGWRALAIVPAAAMVLSGSALAQDGTPTPSDIDNPRVVLPEECIAQPRSYEQIAEMLQLDGEGIAAPAMTQITPPLGEIVDIETEIEITEAIRAVLACFNAGDIPSAAGLMTENGVKRSYWGLTIDEENRTLAQERLQAPPEPRAVDFYVRLLAVTDVSTLPDGRVAAFVVINEPLLAPPGPETLLFILTNQDGQWLVDDFIDFSIVPPGWGAEATPAA